MANDLILLNTDIKYWRTQPDKYEIMLNFVTYIIQDETTSSEFTSCIPKPLRQTMFYAKGLMGMAYLLLTFSESRDGTTVNHLFEIANLNKGGLALLLTHVTDDVREHMKVELAKVVESEEFPWGEKNEI